jgi:hypothetical protein
MIRTDDALAPLIEAGTLTTAQAEAVATALQEAGSARTQSRRRVLSEILSYVGGGVVVVSAWFIVAQVWEPLGVVGRPLVTGVVATILFVAGWLLAGHIHDDPGRRLSSALLTASAALAAATVWTALDPILVGSDPTVAVSDLVESSQPWGQPFTLACAAGTALAISVLGYLRSRSALGHIAMALATFVTTFAIGWTASALVQGTYDRDPVFALLLTAAVGAGWLVMSLRGVFAERLVGQFAGIAAMAIGIQGLRGLDSGEWLVPVLMLVGGLVLMGGYALLRQWPLLVGGVAGVIVGGTELLIEYTEGLVAAVGSLILGLVMLAIGLRLLRERRHDG